MEIDFNVLSQWGMLNVNNVNRSLENDRPFPTILLSEIMETCVVFIWVAFSISPAHMGSHYNQPSELTALDPGSGALPTMILGLPWWWPFLSTESVSCRLYPHCAKSNYWLMVTSSKLMVYRGLRQITIPNSWTMITTEIQQLRPMPRKEIDIHIIIYIYIYLYININAKQYMYIYIYML